ncbi:Uncharacterised protein [Bordetella pertussis]|nr:Uncharacterised protein [Bordetella pertussis]CFP58413.1 Uncharacterised protein [Bordetella pertussis]
MPEPDTPVTHTSRPSGSSIDTLFRLCAVAPSRMSRGVLLATGMGRGASTRWRPPR